MVPRNTIILPTDNSDSPRERISNGVQTEPLTVWLVDDSENFRALLGSLLDEERDLNCARQFPTAEAVLAALKRETAPDLILLDIQMPGMGGVAAVGPIKALAPSTQVLMLTTFFDSEAKSQALRDRAADLILKSLSLEEIAQRVRDVCNHPERFSEAEDWEQVGTHASSWPKCRALEDKHNCCNSAEGEPQLATACGSASERNAVNRLGRGVRFFRSLMNQAIGKKPC